MIQTAWTGIGEQVVQEDRREAFLAAAERTEWISPDGSHPFCQGAAVNAIVQNFGLGTYASIGYDRGWQARGVSEGGYYTIIGIRTSTQRLYFVDRGSDIIPTLIVTDSA